jgi:hypothetical protein
MASFVCHYGNFTLQVRVRDGFRFYFLMNSIDDYILNTGIDVNSYKFLRVNDLEGYSELGNDVYSESESKGYSELENDVYSESGSKGYSESDSKGCSELDSDSETSSNGDWYDRNTARLASLSSESSFDHDFNLRLTGSYTKENLKMYRSTRNGKERQRDSAGQPSQKLEHWQ